MAKQPFSIALGHLNALFDVGAVGGLTDSQLLERFTTGRDEAAELAFAVLVDRHGPMVLRVCQAVLRDAHDAHDAFQATFLVLVKQARGLWMRETLGPWLHQVAHRTASCSRSARARRRRHERLAAASSAHLTAEETPDDLGDVVHEEVGRLPERYRVAVVLCLLEGLTPEQAARPLGWPVGTVHSRLARGRALLRCRLTRRGLAPGAAAPASLLIVRPAPAALAAATVQAALRFTVGDTGAGIVSASIVTLTKEGLRTNMITKLFMAGAMTLALTLAVTAPGVLGHYLQTPETPQGNANPNLIRNEPPGPSTEMIEVAPDGRAFSLAVSPDGKTLAAGCNDSSVHLLDTRTGEKRVALAGVRQGYIRGLGFTPDGTTIAGVCDDRQLRLWEAASGKLLKALPALGDLERDGLPRLSPNTLAISPDGGLIAVGGGGTTEKAHGVIRLDESTFFEVRVLDVKTGELVWSHVGRRGFLHQLAFSPDGKRLASTTQSEIKLWDATTGDLKQTLKPSSGLVWALAFSPDNRLLAGFGTFLVEGKWACSLTLWNVRSGAIVHSINAGQAGRAMAPGTLAFSPDGKSLASAGFGVREGRISIGGGPLARGVKVINTIKLWNVSTGDLVWTSAEGDYGDVTSLVFAPDGESLFCCDSSATTRIDARTGQTRQDLMKTAERRAR